MNANATTASILAIVVVLALLLSILVVAVVRRYDARDGFMPGDAATPKLREAVALIYKDLSCICQAAGGVEQRGAKIEAVVGAGSTAGSNAGSNAGSTAISAEARATLSNARQGIKGIVSNVERLRATVETMTPTYQNVLGLYQGLRDSDQQLWATAQALDRAGARLVSSPAMERAGNLELQAAGEQLRQISTCLYSLVRSVHYLGNALLLE